MNISLTDNFCDFISVDEINYECKNCGMQISLEYSGQEPPIMLCQKSLSRSSVDQPTFIKKIMNFAESTVSHIKSGMPTCTNEQIIQRHDICLGCEFFSDDTCTKCGCPLIRNKQFVSKLAWADQECPVGKWGKIN